MRRITCYGRGPSHLLGIICCVAFVAYVLGALIDQPPWRFLFLFASAIVLHDLAFFPLYALFDRSLLSLSQRIKTAGQTVPWINHIRVPAVISGVLLLLYFPIIFRLTEVRPLYTGLSQQSFLYRWLLVSTIAFVVSGLIYFHRQYRQKFH